MKKRIEAKFKELKSRAKSAFVAYICAGDPNYELSLKILKSLPNAGVDVIELGIPFLDPSGDGVIIESAAKRAIQGGMNLHKVLKMVEEFRKTDDSTPIILMSYYNPIFSYGVDKIFADAGKAGVDGFLIVDLPLEEEKEILSQISSSHLDLIRLISPSTDENRAKKISENASGFLYLVSLMGTTGGKHASASENKFALDKLKKISNLPIAIGFGIQSAQQVHDFVQIGADGVVIGSTIVKEIAESAGKNLKDDEVVERVVAKIKELSSMMK